MTETRLMLRPVHPARRTDLPVQRRWNMEIIKGSTRHARPAKRATPCVLRWKGKRCNEFMACSKRPLGMYCFAHWGWTTGEHLQRHRPEAAFYFASVARALSIAAVAKKIA
jgi:hypothetical protein